jgi:hypothetical protein
MTVDFEKIDFFVQKIKRACKYLFKFKFYVSQMETTISS